MRQHIQFCHSADGKRIAYANTGHGRPLVRAANWLTHLELDWKGPIWSHWFESLSNNRQLVRYDIRGSGLSDRHVEAVSLEVLVSDLEAVVDNLELETFDLLGMCQGGSIAVAYAARHPERVRRLVLYDSYVQGAFGSEGLLVERKREAEVLEEMISIGWGRDNSAFHQVFAELLMPDATAEQRNWLCTLQRQTVSAATAMRLWRAFHEIDVHDAAQQIKAPTLVFHVMGDAMVPFEEGQRLASLIQGARFVPLDGKNHILSRDEPAWGHFVAELNTFLDPSSMPIDTPSIFDELTPREHEILHHIARGLSNGAIADYLVISEKTVRNHVSRVYDKLDVQTRAEAIVLARNAGLGMGERVKPL